MWFVKRYFAAIEWVSQFNQQFISFNFSNNIRIRYYFMILMIMNFIKLVGFSYFKIIKNFIKIMRVSYFKIINY